MPRMTFCDEPIIDSVSVETIVKARQFVKLTMPWEYYLATFPVPISYL